MCAAPSNGPGSVTAIAKTEASGSWQLAWIQVAMKNDFVHMLMPKEMMSMACTNSQVQDIVVITMTERIAWSDNEMNKQQNSYTEADMDIPQPHTGTI